METHSVIQSAQNPKVKEMLRLKEKSRARIQAKKFIIEGLRELELAMECHYKILEFYYEPTILSPHALSGILKKIAGQQAVIAPIVLSGAAFEKLAQRSSTEGIIAVAATKPHTLSDLIVTSKNPLFLVAEAPEKPGNIGALLRTADAAGVDAVIIANPKTDLYNPNVIRSSVGGIFTVAVAMGTSKEVLDFLQVGKSECICSCATSFQASYRSVLQKYDRYCSGNRSHWFREDLVRTVQPKHSHSHARQDRFHECICRGRNPDI
jgi:TrmH family RNA methyltransferase